MEKLRPAIGHILDQLEDIMAMMPRGCQEKTLTNQLIGVANEWHEMVLNHKPQEWTYEKPE